MSVAYLDVSAELIRQVLKLPDDCEVIAGSGDTECGVVRLLVDHASIPKDAIEVSAVFERMHAHGDSLTRFVRFDVTKRRPAPCPECGARK